jgi:sigma-54 dependent transcriptional regulator, acetoin dehydrogenase operon transcriptional activator AcoR
MRCTLEFERRYRAWERFFASGEIDAEVVRPEVAQSWRRCRDLGLDPCAPKRPVHWSADELTSKLRTKGAYIEAALPTTGFLRTAVRGTGFILVLTDEDGIVLDSFGDPEILARAKENNYVPGCCRAENVVGTNAIALAMVERRPVQLTGPEHYNVRHHSWTCASSPVFSPSGGFLGTVTLSGESTDAHRHTLGMVIAASEAIQHRLREQTIEVEKSHSEKLTRSLLKSITDAIVTIDTSGKIVYVNKVAEALLGRGESQLSGQDLATIFTGTDIAGVVAGRSSTSPFEIAYDFRGSRKYFIVKPMVMHDEAGMMGAILALSPRREFLRNVRSLSESAAPYTFADIVGRHSSIRRAVELADMVAKTDSRVLIIGETGTGKELLVQGIHNASGQAMVPEQGQGEGPDQN